MTRRSDFRELAAILLAWFDQNARVLPWRAPIGTKRDPYRVWLAEIMLQQTTVPHAAPYFEAFTRRWPTVEDLAAAQDEEVMRAWAGLGYYARARNLLKCAREVAARGGFPETSAGLRELPGIGPYTAGAIAAIAFGERAAAVDGNVDRVFARLLALKGEWAAEKKRIAAEVAALVPEERPGDFAEALMDLGATICTPTSPNCMICPLTGLCKARAEGRPAEYPVKPAKTAKPVRHGHAWVYVKKDKVWLVRRPPEGLLGGMLALPSGVWKEGAAQEPAPPSDADWQPAGEVRHVFTHFTLRLAVWRANVSNSPAGEGTWADPSEETGLPTVFAKALALATGGTVRRR
ncbi:A/G-specific adenine glycosylase [Hyphomonas neptunium ATCC 15444]|uniref:Adenine DNA glycosylase n=2 Tax=Hyphomonas TaxID=85 RepID=Q0C0X8_HYPNA|nr:MULTISPECIES: A/G-specific adenine glycosylase [Hyphomonas]ABI77975.1 A/G-specific adenine glycosylase [Hyphomonas neptunium ATCC 15444]KCZ94970.1 A/G-specific adenine glycosylase [Hyphomonas hirschiana VP5]